MMTLWGKGLLALWVGLVVGGGLQAKELVKVYPAPVGEPMSKRFSVMVDGKSLPVYVAKVLAIGRVGGADGPEQQVPGEAGFTSFDMSGPVVVTVTYFEKVKTAKVLPTSRGITPMIAGNVITFTAATPDQLTVDVNGDWNNSLHVFANPFETETPNLKDPNLIYFGPGLHVIEPIKVGSGKTVYVAAGAVVYGKVLPGHEHEAVLTLAGSNIRLRGRGILDGSLHSKETASANLLHIQGDHIDVDGVVLRDSSTWTVPVSLSSNVTIRNIKVFGWRGNSDGIDVNNSQHVEISNSFLRTFDDLVVVKATAKGAQPTRDVVVKHIVLWNEIAHALSLGAELRENAENIVFSDCDVIHDKGREWSLRVYNTDSGTAQHVVFENIRMEEDRRPFSLWIGKAIWSRDEERGHIKDVVFRNISAPAPDRPEHAIQFVGFDAQHAIDDVVFENVTVAGKPFKIGELEKNEFVSNVTVKP